MEKLYKVVCNPRNPKILAVGKNYLKHIKEMGGDQAPKEPVIFMKPHSSIVNCDGDTPLLYKLPIHGREVHHEIELGLLIGRLAQPNEEDWLSMVGGYFLALDMTDRDLQSRFKKEGFPWDLAKGQDRFLPLSGLVPLSKVVDPHNLTLELQINGKTVQKDSTASMFYQIPFLLKFLSQHMTLNIGDMLLTGTPHGVGPVKAGDKLRGKLIQEQKTLVYLNLDVEQIEPPT